MPSANERIVATMEKEQEHRHQLQKTQMETWSRLVTFKMWILTFCSAGVFLSLFFVFIRGRFRKA